MNDRLDRSTKEQRKRLYFPGLHRLCVALSLVGHKHSCSYYPRKTISRRGIACAGSLSDIASDQIYNDIRLDTGSSANIRLLKLRYDIIPSSIQCELVPSSLDCKIIYTAVSYVWGDAYARDKTVLLNGRAVQVRHNL